jgi:hypothetical protein
MLCGNALQASACGTATLQRDSAATQLLYRGFAAPQLAPTVEHDFPAEKPKTPHTRQASVAGHM